MAKKPRSLRAAIREEARLKFGKRRPRHLPKAPTAVYPIAIERAYLAAILSGVNAKAKRAVEKILVPALAKLEAAGREGREDDARALVGDAGGVDALVSGVMGRVRVEFERTVTLDNIGRVVSNSSGQLDLFAANNLGKTFKRVLGIDVLDELRRRSPGSIRLLDGWRKDNVKLISTVPDRYFDQIEDLAGKHFKSGKRAAAFSEELQERFKVSETNSARIARDQIGKLNGQVHQLRQTEAGIVAYFWRTVGDERVRDDHADRDGERFLWDSPPDDGHPGEPIQCRCHADPDLDSLLDDLLAA